MKTELPLVSVLMTTFNREQYLPEAIESVLASTYSNFELIISDDCSTDNTVALANSFAAIDKRIKVFINDQNLGDYSNRNKAASLASGKYLKYIDSDDLIYKYALEQMVDIMEQYPNAEWGVSINQQDNEQQFPFVLDARDAYLYFYTKGELFCYSPLNVIIRTALFKNVNGFPEKRMIGDFEMWHKLALTSPVALMPGGMTWYRYHSLQEITNRKEYSVAYELIRLHYLKAVNCPLSLKETRNIIRLRKKLIVKKMLRHLLKAEMSEVNFRFKLLKLYW